MQLLIFLTGSTMKQSPVCRYKFAVHIFVKHETGARVHAIRNEIKYKTEMLVPTGAHKPKPPGVSN